MDKYQIRLGKTDSVNSVNKENFLDVQLNSTSKKLHHNDIKAKIDQYEQFNKERAESSKYRVILTINPYCSNVLFNPLTEVFKVGDDGKITRYFDNTKTISNGIDGADTPLRVQMVSNTEYSKETPDSKTDKNYGYTYMPGYDIFDNHILRNTGFKIVEPTKRDKSVFNTMADYYRSPDMKHVSFKKRVSLDEKPISTDQHLYTSDDLLPFEESVNANLTDENGWFGFINASTLKTTNSDGELSKISCVINNRKNCEFIDMYPDRTTFTFSPYYNKLVDRLEYNWEVFLTYAYESDYCNILVTNGNVNALPVLSVTKGSGISGEEIYIFRCYTKHNLKKGDMIKVYDDSSEDAEHPIGVYRVSNVGNTGKGDPEYYFYIDGFDVDESITSIKGIRFGKTYNGFDSSYYVRKLKKIKKLDGGVEKDLNSERYKLAFASTIYDDDTTQITFTDDIDIGELRDNLGRPLTELFVTIVKTNRGHEEWYSNRNVYASDVEISHCFGDVTAGFILSHEKKDKFGVVKYGDEDEISVCTLLEGMRDARTINNNKKFLSLRRQIVVTPEDDEFLCDVVEFSPEDCLEHVLADCAYRFNTYQREHHKDEVEYEPIEASFTYHEVLYDDYDVYEDTTFIDLKVTENRLRNEGYYYKANYSVPIKGIGDISQSGNKEIRVRSAKPVFNGNIVLRVNSSLPSRLNTNDTVYVCDDVNNKMFEFVCTGVKSPTLFSIEPKGEGKWAGFKAETGYISGGLTWLGLSQMLSDGLLKLRGKNYDIPDYAFKFGTNTYMWRDVVTPGEKAEIDVPEYTFTNDAFYITPIIRFYLKRQDPDDSIGLQAKELFPNDVFGNIKKQSNYYYEDEPQDLC